MIPSTSSAPIRRKSVNVYKHSIIDALIADNKHFLVVVNSDWFSTRVPDLFNISICSFNANLSMRLCVRKYCCRTCNSVIEFCFVMEAV